MNAARSTAADSVLAATQVVVASAVIFVAYRYIAVKLGISILGVWSVSASMCALLSLVDMGAAEALLRIVPRSIAEGDHEAAGKAVRVSALFVAVIGALGACVLYFPAMAVLEHSVEPALRDTGRALVPFALLTAWLNVVSAGLLCALEGVQRYDARSAIMISGSVLYMIAVFVLGSRMGALAIGIAAALQAAWTAVAAWSVIRRGLGIKPWVPFSVDLRLTRELIGLGAPLKLVGVLGLFTEPLGKFFVMTFGGSHLTGIYEMASRLPSQTRAIVVAVGQVSVPRFIKNSAMGSPVDDLFKYTSSAVAAVATCGFAILALALPTVSHVWLQNVDADFLAIATLMICAWMLNALSSPSYFVLLGTGRMHWNVLAHISQVILIVVLGYGLGRAFGGKGAAAGAAAALGISSLVPIAIQHKLSAMRVWPISRADLIILLAVALICAVTYFAAIHVGSWHQDWHTSLVLTVLFVPAAAAYLWKHETGRQLFHALLRGLNPMSKHATNNTAA